MPPYAELLEIAVTIAAPVDHPDFQVHTFGETFTMPTFEVVTCLGKYTQVK